MSLFEKLVLALYAALVINFLSGYGSCWECGRYGMPSTLLAADGRHYPDGSEVDEVTLAMARSGHEEETYLFIFGILGCVLVVGSWLIWCDRRKQRAEAAASARF